MKINWNQKEPIYIQLRDKLVELILDGVLLDEQPLPSVRQIASEQRINPITVSKAFQLLVDEGLVEKRRGLGMYVVSGARETLSRKERNEFLEKEWPVIRRKMERLGLEVNDLPGGQAAGEE